MEEEMRRPVLKEGRKMQREDVEALLRRLRNEVAGNNPKYDENPDLMPNFRQLIGEAEKLDPCGKCMYVVPIERAELASEQCLEFWRDVYDVASNLGCRVGTCGGNVYLIHDELY